MSVAKHWIQTCNTSPEHSLCRDTYGPSGLYSPLPTRVLNVGPEDQEPFLFESNGLKQRYCILSYCWSLAGNTVTTKDNFLRHTKSIPLASLPTLLRQAILATRSLGYKYLWIDALCIIQDDLDDRAREAAMMHELYSRADLMLTSLVAADSRDNLFESRLRETARPIPLKVFLSKKYRHSSIEHSLFELAAYPNHHDWLKCVMEGPVHQRAWTLQEHLMSTRVVNFGPGILHWEYLCSYRLESDPEGMCIEFRRKELEARRSLKLAVKACQQPENSHHSKASPFEVWQSQVEEFTRRRLTKHSDRIPAFLAISKVLCQAAGDDFSGGIWNGKQLIPSMCWQLQQPDETDMRGPSWTWGARSGKISYELLRHEGKMMPKASIISVDISTDKSHSHTSGSITLKGFFGVCRPRSSNPSASDL
ncbi:HET domain-containing protein [Colletotrichum sojae]|uniref:HET domain-containing protein n=1 Tax=Colletotrichum sojae TaxID=2175907 RepID=A0A8H6MP32_9PEZI|nr:HET domain-containing protein [Colletotrichum sojae]